MADKVKEPVKQPPQIPPHMPVPQIIHMLGLIRLDIPYIRDAYPLALITREGIVPVNRKMIDDIHTELKKLEIKEQDAGYII